MLHMVGMYLRTAHYLSVSLLISEGELLVRHSIQGTTILLSRAEVLMTTIIRTKSTHLPPAAYRTTPGR